MVVCWGRIGGLHAMWGVFAGIAIWVAVHPFLMEWMNRRATQKSLEDMRSRAARGDRWDTLRGRWME